MESSKIKPFYFFHIPKTGGRFLFVNTANIIKYDMLKNNMSTKGVLNFFGHRSFVPVEKQDILSITILREPVSRTISHYLHIYENRLTGNIKKDKKRFFKFLKRNKKDAIINYQTKFISYNGEDEFIDIDNKNMPKVENLELAKKRISMVNYVLDSKDISHSTANFLLNKLYKNFNLKNPGIIANVYYETIINPESKALFDSLSPKERVWVENMMKNDMELYYSTQFYK
jgi:hypothetical protein